MRTFSVAEQTVTDPATGAILVFGVDPDDTSRVFCHAYGAPKDGAKDKPQDYLCATFQRNGLLETVKMVDAEVEADQLKRKEAERRLALKVPAESIAETDEERKKAAAAAEKQAQEDKALLASQPKVSKYATEDEKKAAAAVKPAPAPDVVNKSGDFYGGQQSEGHRPAGWTGEPFPVGSGAQA